MEKESQILESLSVLEKELDNLGSQLSPLMLSPTPAGPGTAGSSPVEPDRSPVNERLTRMIRQVRDLQQRLEI